MKTTQLEANQFLGDRDGGNNEILRAAGVKRIHSGWYTVTYNGVVLDASVVVSARRNRGGEIRFDR